MKYALSALALWLPKHLRPILKQQTGGRDPVFEDVRWIRDGSIPEDPRFFYVGPLERTKSQLNDSVWCLTAAAPGCADDQLLALPAADALELYDILRDAVYTLNQWVMELDAAVMDHRSVQDVLDISMPILRNPIAVFDTSFHVVAATSNITEEDAPLYDTVRAGIADPGTILMLQTVNRTQFSPLGGRYIYQTTTEVRGVEELFIHLYDENNLLVARLNACCREIPLSEGFLHLLLILLTRISRILAQNSPGRAFRDQDDYFLRQLIEGAENPEQIAHVLNIPAEGEFVMLCPYMEHYDLQKSYNIAGQIERIIPLSRPFLYDDQLFVFVGVNASNRNLSSYWDYQMQRIQEIGEMLDLRIGISDKFTRISQIRQYCFQARAAMRLSGCPRHAHWSFVSRGQQATPICQYKEIAIYAVVERLMMDTPPEWIGTPVYWEMRRHDQERGTNNCEVIRLYFQNDCEAALTAAQLYMHRNSIVYRVNKLAETYGFSLKDPQTKLLFLLSSVVDELTSGTEE